MAEQVQQKNQAPNKACETCRSLKIRCLPSSDKDKCQRCLKFDETCVHAVPTRRRQRRRVDARVEELESQVKKLSLLLQTRESKSQEATDDSKNHLPLQANTDGHTRLDVISDDAPTSIPTSISPARSRSTTSFDTQSTKCPTGLPLHFEIGEEPPSTTQYRDIVDRAVISMDMASRLYTRFMDEFNPQLPLLMFESGYNAATLRQEKPVLFLSMMSVTIESTSQELRRKLTLEAHRVLAEAVVVRCEKSLDLIQSLVILVAWSFPPNNYDKMKYIRFTQMTATLVEELGLSKRPRSRVDGVSTKWRNREIPASARATLEFEATNALDLESDECRRTYIIAYTLCTGISHGSRRPRMLAYNGWTEDCIKYLEQSDHKIERTMAKFCRLRNIVFENSTYFLQDDFGPARDLRDARTRLSLRASTRILENWKESSPDIWNDTFNISYHVSMIYINEVAMHMDHNAEDFQAPFTLERYSKKPEGDVNSIPLTDSILINLSSAQIILETFLSMEITTLRIAPTVMFVNVMYACVILVKLYSSVTTPGNPLASLIELESLRVGYYLDRVVKQFHTVQENEDCLIATKFYTVAIYMTAWFYRQTTQDDTSENKDEAIQPLTYFVLPSEVQNSLERVELPNCSTKTTGNPNYTPSNVLPPPPPSQINFADTEMQGLDLPGLMPFWSDANGELDSMGQDIFDFRMEDWGNSESTNNPGNWNA